jgi:hypothetical protein
LVGAPAGPALPAGFFTMTDESFMVTSDLLAGTEQAIQELFQPRRAQGGGSRQVKRQSAKAARPLGDSILPHYMIGIQVPDGRRHSPEPADWPQLNWVPAVHENLAAVDTVFHQDWTQAVERIVDGSARMLHLEPWLAGAFALGAWQAGAAAGTMAERAAPLSGDCDWDWRKRVTV